MSDVLARRIQEPQLALELEKRRAQDTRQDTEHHLEQRERIRTDEVTRKLLRTSREALRHSYDLLKATDIGPLYMRADLISPSPPTKLPGGSQQANEPRASRQDWLR